MKVRCLCGKSLEVLAQTDSLGRIHSLMDGIVVVNGGHKCASAGAPEMNNNVRGPLREERRKRMQSITGTDAELAARIPREEINRCLEEGRKAKKRACEIMREMATPTAEDMNMRFR